MLTSELIHPEGARYAACQVLDSVFEHTWDASDGDFILGNDTPTNRTHTIKGNLLVPGASGYSPGPALPAGDVIGTVTGRYHSLNRESWLAAMTSPPREFVSAVCNC